MDKKRFFGISALFFGLVLVFTAACSGYSKYSLTGVVFGKVMIDGDQNDLVADAIREALYFRGASYQPDSSPVVGRVEWHELRGFEANKVDLQIRIDDFHLAAVADSSTYIWYDGRMPIVKLAKDVAFIAVESMSKQNLARKSSKI